MEVHSLGYRTDLIFARFDGDVRDRGDFLVVRTPANPGYYWGNFLLSQEAPKDGDDRAWPERFRREIGGPPTVAHQAFGWDSQKKGMVQAFLESGFQLRQLTVMACTSPRRPDRVASQVEIRPLVTDEEQEAAIENQVLCREPGHEEADYRRFVERQTERYARMTAAGLGDWYGAFYQDRLVADLGLYGDDELGRYQSVETHPDFRRRGIAGTMVYQAGRRAIAKYGLRSLVIVAETESDASRLYTNTGFVPVESQWGLENWPNASD
jgi:GNAT superfamily N-acetyltransferase